MSKDLVFEIGAEEIPASYIRPALDQLKGLAADFFKEQRLQHGEISVEGTPRRLALLVKKLEEKQADRDEEAQGPSAKVAFADGKPTQVAEGFARSKGVNVKDLEVKSTPKGDYVFAQVHQKGKPSTELLEAWLPQAIRKLAFPKSMRWADGGPLRFARPINWLLGLYGKRVLKFEVEFLKSGPFTRGHRFLAPKPIALKDAGEYLRKLKAAHVQLSFEARCASIRSQLAAVSKKVGTVIEDAELVEACANLVEEPSVLLGTFDEKYLALPEAVTIKAMREHQFCFAARDKAGKLAPVFLVVTNGNKKNLDEIREGNAAVIRARLEDASFFFREDQKQTLEQRLEELKNVVWLEGLGTQRDRVERISKLATWLAERLAPQEKEAAGRAGLLCKSDLVSLMVGEKEYASLQGTMGGLYAKLGGESGAVSDAISGHYRPRFAGDAVPATRAGQFVAAADKMDDLAGCFGMGLIPSGSQDPYALRRKAAGLVAILKAQDSDLSFAEFAGAAVAAYEGKLKSPAAEVVKLLKDFFRQRLENALLEEGLAQDLVDAVCSKRHELTREAFVRAKALSRLRSRDDWEMAAQAFSRVNNILSKVTEIKPVQEALLSEGPEQVLHERFFAIRPVAERACALQDFEGAFSQLASLRPAIDSYFASVMVMAEDPALRLNRLSFLAQMSQTLNLIADFTKLVKK